MHWITTFTMSSHYSMLSLITPTPSPISSRSFRHDFATKLLKYGTFCRVRSAACTVLDVFVPYLAQMITSMRECVACNDLWPWLISSSFSHGIAIKLLKYGTSCHVCSTACTVLGGFFPYVHKWSLAGEGVSRAMTFDLDLYLQVTQPWLWNKTTMIWHILSCPLYNMYSSGCILSLFGTNDH